jgi:hypothetical protein
MHASLILKRSDAERLHKLFSETGNFPEAAEALDFVLHASLLPAVAVITTLKRIDQMQSWLREHKNNTPEFASIFQALQRAHETPFHEEPPITVI